MIERLKVVSCAGLFLCSALLVQADDSISRPERAGIARTIWVSKPVFVQRGQTLNGLRGEGRQLRYRAVADKLGDGSQDEGQKPVILAQGGAHIRNVILDKPAADGIRIVLSDKPSKTYITNVDFRDVGEDAITVAYGNSHSSVYIRNCQFYQAVDKVIQVNSSARVYIDDCYFEDFTRAVRACGTCGNKNYRIYMDQSTAVDGKTVLKMSNSKARGEIENTRIRNVKYVSRASGGAVIREESTTREGVP